MLSTILVTFGLGALIRGWSIVPLIIGLAIAIPYGGAYAVARLFVAIRDLEFDLDEQRKVGDEFIRPIKAVMTKLSPVDVV